MAPAENLSPAGSSSYSSDTMVVGDGTWSFTKNTFLLPNLVGLNFDTMQYNGMGNRFSTLTQYHTIVLAHGVIAAITFLFIIPIAIMIARFYSGKPGYARRYHAYLNVLAVGLATVVFVLGWFAVGPSRSLTNPHHGIGVAIYTLILLQAIGGRLVKKISHYSFRITVHQWSGRAIAILGIVQVPLGLTLYGSPKFTFILFALWMAFLFLLYFILSYRHEKLRSQDMYMSGGKVEGRGRSKERKSSGGGMKWLGPLAAGAGAFALLRGRKHERANSRDRSRSRSRATTHRRGHSRGPEVIPSRRGSDSLVYTGKHANHTRTKEGGGFMSKVLGVGAAVGAGALVSKFMKRKDKRPYDEEYSAVATDTPSKPGRHYRTPSKRRGGTVITDYSDETESYHRDGRRSPLLPGPGGPTAAAAALSAAAARPGTATTATRPVTPPPTRPAAGHSRVDSYMDSDYSSYQSPSRRTPAPTSAGKGILAGLGLGWFAKKMKDRKDRKDEDRLRLEEDERRAGISGPRYTGDGHPTPTRRESRRPGGRPPPRAHTVSDMSDVTSSIVESRPVGSGPPMPPFVAPGGAPPPPVMPVTHLAHSQSRFDTVPPAVMPPMPGDPMGVLNQEPIGPYASSAGPPPQRRESSRRRHAGEAAAAQAVLSATRLAAQEDRRRRDHSRDPSQPVSVKVKVHDDRDRNVTLRRLTEQEAEASRREAQRRRNDSMSSLSGTESPSARRYRRDSSVRRAESEAERRVDERSQLTPLSPPNPAFAAGKRPKDSAYYSGAPTPGAGGPSGTMSAAGHTVSSIDSSHGTWSGASPSPSAPLRNPTASAAERRRRRRLERTRPPGPAGQVDFS